MNTKGGPDPQRFCAELLFFSILHVSIIIHYSLFFGAPNFCSTVPSPRSVMALNRGDLYKIVVTRSSASDNMMSDVRLQLRIAWSIIALHITAVTR